MHTAISCPCMMVIKRSFILLSRCFAGQTCLSASKRHFEGLMKSSAWPKALVLIVADSVANKFYF